MFSALIRMFRSTSGVVALFFLAVFAAAVFGWVNNIVTLAHAAEFSGMVILRAIGIFFTSLGVVLGYV